MAIKIEQVSLMNTTVYDDEIGDATKEFLLVSKRVSGGWTVKYVTRQLDFNEEAWVKEEEEKVGCYDSREEAIAAATAFIKDALGE